MYHKFVANIKLKMGAVLGTLGVFQDHYRSNFAMHSEHMVKHHLAMYRKL